MLWNLRRDAATTLNHPGAQTSSRTLQLFRDPLFRQRRFISVTRMGTRYEREPEGGNTPAFSLVTETWRSTRTRCLRDLKRAPRFLPQGPDPNAGRRRRTVDPRALRRSGRSFSSVNTNAGGRSLNRFPNSAPRHAEYDRPRPRIQHERVWKGYFAVPNSLEGVVTANS